MTKKKTTVKKKTEIRKKAETAKQAETGKKAQAAKQAGIRKKAGNRKRAETKERAEARGKGRVNRQDARSAAEIPQTRDPLPDASVPEAGGAAAVAHTRAFVPDVSVAFWLTAVAAAGGMVSADRVRLVDGLMKSLKGCGVWDRLDRLWVFAAENQAQALVDLVGLGKATLVNEPSFIPDLGYVFDGSTQYIETNFDAAAASAPRYSRNSASFGGAIFAGATITGVEFGNDYSAYSMLITRYSNMRRFQINSATDSAQKIPHNEAFVGHFHGQRSADNLTELFLDGVLQGSSLEPSSQVPAQTFFVGAGRERSGPSNYSNASISTAHIGGGFSPDQVVQFDTAIRTYLNSIAPSPNS